ncbi:SPOSA6832_01196, partial [Sporobolomyces salmonicolor]
MTRPSNAHRQYVQHLYRRALKGAQDCDLWRNKAIEIRAQFERNRNVRDPRAVAALLNEAEKEVQRLAHPDPYRPSHVHSGREGRRSERALSVLRRERGVAYGGVEEAFRSGPQRFGSKRTGGRLWAPEKAFRTCSCRDCREVPV